MFNLPLSSAPQGFFPPLPMPPAQQSETGAQRGIAGKKRSHNISFIEEEDHNPKVRSNQPESDAAGAASAAAASAAAASAAAASAAAASAAAASAAAASSIAASAAAAYAKAASAAAASAIAASAAAASAAAASAACVSSDDLARAQAAVQAPLLSLYCDEILDIPFAQWQQCINNPSRPAAFPDRIQTLRSMCTQFKSNLQTHKGVISIKPGEISHIPSGFQLNLLFEQDGYFSNAIAQESFEQGIPPGAKPSYHYLKIYEGDDVIHPLFLIRADLQGLMGEVVYLKKGTYLSGTDIKNILLTPLLNYLGIQQVIKHDDSTRTIVSAKNTDILLRLLLPIVNKAGGPDEGSTWYGKDGFTPMSCNELRYPKSQLIVTQDPKYYFAALEKMRCTTLGTLHQDVLYKTKRQQQQLARLAQKYFPQSVQGDGFQKDVVFTTLTVAELGAAVFAAAAQKSADQNLIKTANQDLVLFYKICLSPSNLDENASRAACVYNLALDTLQSHYFWIKSFQDPALNISYAQFKRNPHQSFDELIAGHAITPFTTWQNLCGKPAADHSAQAVPDETPDLVPVKQLTNDEFMEGFNSAALAAASNPLDRLRAICSLCTENKFEDNDSKKYWQLWIELNSSNKKSKGFLELNVLPKSGTDNAFVLTVKNYEKNQVLMVVEVKGEGAELKTLEQATGRASLKPQIDTVLRLIQSILNLPA